MHDLYIAELYSPGALPLMGLS